VGDLALRMYLRCRAHSFSCGRGCWVRCAAVSGGSRRGCTSQAHLRLAHAALARCLEAGRAGPAAAFGAMSSEQDRQVFMSLSRCHSMQLLQSPCLHLQRLPSIRWNHFSLRPLLAYAPVPLGMRADLCHDCVV